MYQADSSENSNLPLQVRTNALTSYFFLGFLYLLAYTKPNFSHPFVRSHAWSATRLHLGFIGFLIVYHTLLAKLLDYQIPVIEITLSRVLFSTVLLGLLGLLFRGSYLAYHGKKFKAFDLMHSDNSADFLSNQKISGEADLMRSILSFFPIIGVFIAERFPTPLTQVGSKVSGYGTLLLLVEFIFLRGDNLLMITLFFIIVLIVTTGAFLATNRSVGFLSPIQMLPGLNEIQLNLKTVPLYLLDVFLVIIGRKNELSFLQKREEISLRMKHSEKELEAFFSDSHMVFSPYIIYIPFINLIFIYQFFAPQKSRYVLAINQGIILTLLILLFGYLLYPNLRMTLLAVLPIMLGVATIKNQPFLQIPILHEIGSLLTYITFGIVSGTKNMREKSKEVREIRLKVE